MSFGLLNTAILTIYLGAMVAVGVWFSRRQKTTEDYFLAGRRMPWIVVSMSIFASLTSAISYMGVPRTAYKENISMLAGYLAGPLVAVCLIWLFLPFYHRLRVTTSYEYIDRRFGLSGRLAVSTLFLLARLGWLGTVIYAPALALSVATGMPLVGAIILIGAVATVYTVLGGLSAVLWTDMVQFIILVGGGIWVSISLIQGVPDGIEGIWQTAAAAESPRTGGFNWSFSLFELTATAAVAAAFFGSLQDYGTDQVTVQRILAIGNFRGMAKAVLLNSIFDILIMGMLCFMGIGMFAYYHHFPDRLAEGVVEDRLLPYYIMQALPPGASGLVITAIFAAAMSSMDSGIHSVSTVITNDFVRPLRGNRMADREVLMLARVLVVVLGVVATAVAFVVSGFDHILAASSRFLGMFSAPVLALFVLGVLTRRANFGGWLVGLAAALATTIAAQYVTFGAAAQKLHWLYYFPVSFLVCLVVGYVAGLLFAPSPAPKELTIWGRGSGGATTDVS